jgi:hypothetical protein
MIFTRIAKLPLESHEPDDGDALLGKLCDLHAAQRPSSTRLRHFRRSGRVRLRIS